MGHIKSNAIGCNTALIDAQSFSKSFEGVLGVVRKYRGVLYFCVLLVYYIFMTKFSKSFEGILKVPPSSAIPMPPSLCASMSLHQWSEMWKMCKSSNPSNLPVRVIQLRNAITTGNYRQKVSNFIMSKRFFCLIFNDFKILNLRIASVINLNKKQLNNLHIKCYDCLF